MLPSHLTELILVIFTVIKRTMLEVDGISVEEFSRKGSSCSSIPIKLKNYNYR